MKNLFVRLINMVKCIFVQKKIRAWDKPLKVATREIFDNCTLTFDFKNADYIIMSKSMFYMMPNGMPYQYLLCMCDFANTEKIVGCTIEKEPTRCRPVAFVEQEKNAKLER